MKAQEKIQIISEISSSNLLEDLKLILIRDVLAKTSETSQETLKPAKTAKTAKTVKRDGRPTKNAITLELLSSCAGASVEEIVQTILLNYPEENEKYRQEVESKVKPTLVKTTERRFKGEMNLNGKEVVHDEVEGKVLYFLQEKESNY